MSSKKPVVLDNGSGFLKAGFAGANFPTAVFQTGVGRPILRAGSKHNPSAASALGGNRVLKDVMRGDETNEISHLLDMSYPVRNGIIQDMDEMCVLWDYAFSERLNVNPAEHRLMLSEPPNFSNKHRCKLYEVMFEKYGVPHVQSAVQGVLSLFSNGLTTGVSVECGEGVTHCTPVFDGYGIPKANRRVDLGGRNITEFLVRLMQRRGYSFNRSSDFETVRCIKEKFCYAAVDAALEKKLALETTVLEKALVLPDGTTIRIGQERFEATEALFSPGLIDIESDGLSLQLWNCIQAADIDVRSSLYEHVVLSGGSTMFPGLSSRIDKDMRSLFLEKALRGDASRLGRFKLNIEDPPRRKHMVFLGAAVMAEATADDDGNWMTKAEWEEGGNAAVKARFGGA
jgi:actin-related protein 2